MIQKLTKIISSAVLGVAALAPISCFSPQIIKSHSEMSLTSLLSQKQKEYVQMVDKIDKTLVKHNDPDKIDLQVLVEKNYIEVCREKKVDWWDMVRYNITTHSARKFKDQFNIQLEIDGVKYITLDNVNDAGYLFSQIRFENDVCKFDAVISFVARPIEGILGLAEFKGNYALIMHHKNEHKTTQHEISHLFGAIDIYTCDPDWWNDAKEKAMHPMWNHATIMTYQAVKSDKWNTANILRMNNAKNRSWKYSPKKIGEIKEYVLKFDKKHQSHIVELFHYAGSYFYSAHGEKLAGSLCAEFPEEWKLKYLYTEILEKKRDDRKIVEITKLYKKILKLNPPAWVYNNIAWNIGVEQGYLLYLGLDCLKLAQKSVQINPNDFNLDTLGYIYYKTKRYSEAEECLEKACENTKNLGIATHLAKLYHRTGRLKKFKKAVKKMLEIEPEEGMIHYNYAIALMTRFADKLDKKEKIEVLDVALDGYDIYPCDAFTVLVMDAYEFNAGNQDDEFKRKYKDRVMNILFGGKQK